MPSVNTQEVSKSSEHSFNLSEQQAFCLNLGWDETACEAYTVLLKQRVSNSEISQTGVVEECQKELFLVGSPLYFQLFKRSAFTAREKVQLLLKQLGSTLDQHGMLQLTGPHRIDPNMPPHSKFLEYFAACVKKGYPGGLVADAHPSLSKEELKCVHQFRYYIDRQNLFYIRSNYNGGTDVEKLLAYVSETGQNLNYHDSSRFHNRMSLRSKAENYSQPLKETRTRQANDKIKTANGLSEFIVNVDTGCFVSQWNHLRTINGHLITDEKEENKIAQMNELINSNPKDYDLAGNAGKDIANTESFNYDRGFFDWLPWRRAHDFYDMKPSGQEKFDSDIRKQAKRNWPFPRKYREHYRTARKIQKAMRK